jgi:hypothetical protein
MRIAKRAALLLSAAVGGTVLGYLAVLIGLFGLALAWNLASLVVRIEGQDFTSDGWKEFGGVVAAVGGLVGLVVCLYWEIKEEMNGPTLLGVGVLGLLAVYGFIYGTARVGEELFGSFGWGLVLAFGLLFVGCGVGGLIHGLRQASEPGRDV